MNYKEIIEKLQDEDVIKMMEGLGVHDYRETDIAIIFPTICHNADPTEASMKLYYYKNTKLFYCYTSCHAQSIFKFLRNVYEARGIEYDWHQDIYLPIVNCTPRRNLDGFSSKKRKLLREQYKRKKREVELAEYPKGVLDVFVKEYPAQWLADGISKEAMDKFNILFSISQNKIVIPHHDAEGRLIGIRGRALNDWEVENLGKYMPMQIEGKWYSHSLSLNLYGLNQNKENIRETGNVYIFESEKAVLQFESFNQPNCAVAVCGSSLNKFQIDILIRTCYPSNFIICFDKEEEQGEEYFNKLYKLCQKYRNYGNFSFLYDMQGLLNMKESPSDRGEEVFNKLIGRRIKVK